MAEQNTLRDTIVANLEAAEAGTLGEQTQIIEDTSVSAEQRARDEQGRFAPKEPVQAQPQEQTAPVEVQAAPVETLQRPTTWKKEYVPIWDKLAQGLPLLPEEAKKLAEYSNQREKEYATGVSTYRAEAQNARELHSALEPFLPELQRHNLQPAQWIRQVGEAHRTLANGTPEQKIQMFMRLASDYGIPINAITQQQGQLDPVAMQLMQQIQQLNSQVNTVTSWRDQQEQQQVTQMVKQFEDAEKYPHFQMVRGTMAQLLESGFAQDLQTAYDKAVRMNDEVWNAEQERQATLKANQANAGKAAVVAKAKANVVSPRSTTPSGAVVTKTAKDRRSILEEQLASADGRV